MYWTIHIPQWMILEHWSLYLCFIPITAMAMILLGARLTNWNNGHGIGLFLSGLILFVCGLLICPVIAYHMEPKSISTIKDIKKDIITSEEKDYWGKIIKDGIVRSYEYRQLQNMIEQREMKKVLILEE